MGIRKSIFETNSSSSHAVCIDTRGGLCTPYESKFDEDIVISAGEYGWESGVLSYWHGKACYAYTYALNYGTENDMIALKELLSKYFPKSKIIFTPDNKDHSSCGYIDHQSIDEASTIFEDGNLELVIFGEKSRIVLGNDNG